MFASIAAARRPVKSIQVKSAAACRADVSACRRRVTQHDVNKKFSMSRTSMTWRDATVEEMEKVVTTQGMLDMEDDIVAIQSALMKSVLECERYKAKLGGSDNVEVEAQKEAARRILMEKEFAEEEGILAVVKETKNQLEDLHDLAQNLQRSKERSSRSSWLTTSSRDLQAMGRQYEELTTVLDTIADGCLARLADRLKSFKVQKHLFPLDEEEAMEILQEQLAERGDHIVAAQQIGDVSSNMRLAWVNGSPVPPNADLDTVMDLVSDADDKEKLCLTFVKRVSKETCVKINKLFHMLEIVMKKLQKCDALSLSDLHMPGAGGKLDDVDDHVNHALELRIRWDVRLDTFRRVTWSELKTDSSFEVDLTEPITPPVSDKGRKSVANVGRKSVAAIGGKGKGPAAPGKGTGKGKGEGPPAPKGGGKGPCRPPAKGGGPALPGKGEWEGDPTEDESEEVPWTPLSRAMRVCDARCQQPMFGTRDKGKVPRAGLTAHDPEKRTFVTRIAEERENLNVADIAAAFSGQGPLLLHICFTEESATPKDRPKQEKVKREFTQVVKGPVKGIIDSRRLPWIKALVNVGCCDGRCAGRGLVMPDAGMACSASHALAFSLASLDFDLFTRKGVIEMENIPFPALDFSERVDEAAEMAVIETCFLKPEECTQLRTIVEEEDAIETLDASLERRIYPLTFVPSLSVKVKLFCMFNEFQELEKTVSHDFDMVLRACDSVRTSECFLDVLAVTLQMSNYLNAFGNLHSTENSFNLMKLDALTTYSLGTRKFVTVMCLYLSNLRCTGASTKSGRQPKSSTPRSRREDEKPSSVLLDVPRSERGRSASNKRGRSTPRSKGDKESKVPPFMDVLESEMSAVMAVQEKEERLKRSNLLANVSKFEGMKRYLQSWLNGPPDSDRCEMQLFSPDDPESVDDESSSIGEAESSEPSQLLELSPIARYAQNAAWVQGRAKLKMFLRMIDQAIATTEKNTSLLAEAEEQLKEYAGVGRQDMERVDYNKIFDVVVKFTKRLKENWAAVSLQCEPLKFLRVARPLALILTESRKSILLFWSDVSKKKVKRWTPEERTAVMEQMFRVFDLDGSGAVDAEEFRVTLGALGIVLPHDGPLHFQLVSFLDKMGSGKVDQTDFNKFIRIRLAASFRMFNGGGSSSKPIEFKEMEKAARGLLDADQIWDMLTTVTTSSGHTDCVTFDTFEQIMLSPKSQEGTGWSAPNRDELSLWTNRFKKFVEINHRS